MITRADIRAAIAKLGKPGLATKRACERQDVFYALRQARKAKHRVRVYSRQGFVPNAYKFPCQIQYVEVIKAEGSWHIIVGWTGAQRSRGQGNLCVVQ